MDIEILEGKVGDGVFHAKVGGKYSMDIGKQLQKQILGTSSYKFNFQYGDMNVLGAWIKTTDYSGIDDTGIIELELCYDKIEKGLTDNDVRVIKHYCETQDGDD